MKNLNEQQTADGQILEILHEADKYTPEDGIKPSEFWTFREEVRVKYQLPECSERWEDPVEYIHAIEGYAYAQGIEIRPKHEFTSFFQEHGDAGAVTFGKSKFGKPTLVARDVESDDWWSYRGRANQLSHEIVHGVQDIRYPNMPDDLAEWEAYAYQLYTPDFIENHAEDSEFISRYVNEIIRSSVISSTSIDATISPQSSR